MKSWIKEEEWFRQKYHPEDSVKRREDLKSMLLRRVELFQVRIQKYSQSSEFDWIKKERIIVYYLKYPA